MKKRLLKKRLRDASDEDVIMLSFERKLSRRTRKLVKQEMSSRFETVITTMEIRVLQSMLETEVTE